MARIVLAFDSKDLRAPRGGRSSVLPPHFQMGTQSHGRKTDFPRVTQQPVRAPGWGGLPALFVLCLWIVVPIKHGRRDGRGVGADVCKVAVSHLVKGLSAPVRGDWWWPFLIFWYG